MTIKFKTTFPLESIAEKVVSGLKQIGVEAKATFVVEIPRHYLISMEISEKAKPKDLIELGRLIQILDRP